MTPPTAAFDIYPWPRARMAWRDPERRVIAIALAVAVVMALAVAFVGVGE